MFRKVIAQDNSLDPQVQDEQKDQKLYTYVQNDKSNSVDSVINKLKEFFSGHRIRRENNQDVEKYEAGKSFYLASRSHNSLFDPLTPQGIQNRIVLDETFEKLNLESQKTRINYNSAYDGIKRYVLDGEGKTEFNTVQDYILSLNAIEEQNIKLMDFAKYVERLKVLSPNLDSKTYNIANQALYQAKLKTNLPSDLNFRNVGAVNKILRNMLERREINRDVYFTAIEMARLSSVIMEK